MHPLRVATWNIRKAIGLDRRRDPNRVLHAVAALGADIVALQEADRRLGDRPGVFGPDHVEAVTGLVPIAAANGRSIGWHGNAILARPSLRVTGVLRLDLPGLEPRGALGAEFSVEDWQVRVIGVHLGLMRRHRQDQLAALVAEVASRPAMPTVILGDFNEWSRRRGLEPLEVDFAVHAPGCSYHAARPVARLDRIAVSARLKVDRTGVSHTNVTRIASDHLPVWADIEPA